MKKKSNWLAIVSCLLLVACGSRKVSIANQDLEVVKQGEKTEQTTTESTASFSIKKWVKTLENIDNVEHIYIKEYYENGVLKSERKEIKSHKQEKTAAKQGVLQGNSSKIETAQKTEKHRKKTTLKTKEKQTKREAYPWYWWVISGFVLGVITPWLLKWIGKFYMRI